MDLSKVDLSELNVENLNLTSYEEDGRVKYGKFTEDNRPLIIYDPYVDVNGENDFKYLFIYDYDNQKRLIKRNILYSWAWIFKGWASHSYITYKYLGDNPNPTQVNLSNGFWVSNQYDKNGNLTQSVTSEGATLLQLWDEDGYLMNKFFKIKVGEEYFEYKYTFGIDKTEFIQYEDSFGNFWDVSNGYPCPYENPVKVYDKGFLDDNYLYN